MSTSQLHFSPLGEKVQELLAEHAHAASPELVP